MSYCQHFTLGHILRTPWTEPLPAVIHCIPLMDAAQALAADLGETRQNGWDPIVLYEPDLVSNWFVCHLKVGH